MCGVILAPKEEMTAMQDCNVMVENDCRGEHSQMQTHARTLLQLIPDTFIFNAFLKKKKNLKHLEVYYPIHL